MQVINSHDVKIYNLSAGKTLPEWLSDRKRRQLLKKNVDLRRRIELIQDFDMPALSSCIRLSKDGQYIFATGTYKPRVKCFDVNNLSLKFERCFDSEVVTFEVLSEDYRKLVFLQCDRYVEFHTGEGRFYRLRIPRFGRDMKYHEPSCDLFLVGTSNQVYRFNLERGQFLAPFEGDAFTINKCDINPVHQLLACGTADGKVEAWDPRMKTRVGVLDCGLSVIGNSRSVTLPSITALRFNGALSMGVGTSNGNVLLYDIRSNKPLFVKDHLDGFPILDVQFHYQDDLIFSLDQSMLKIWNKNNGQMFTSIGSNSILTSLCTVPRTGMFFMANEAPKMQSYYVPGLGPAPKWVGFLDSITEELEETVENVYDDYKFVTKGELANLGLEHMVGTNLLKAYMHGYFMDARLYKKVHAMVEPLEFEQYRKKKIREKINDDRTNRVQIDKLPKINQDLALKLMNDKDDEKKRKRAGKLATATTLLEDNRFKALFENPDFQVDKTADEYRLLNPVLTRLDKVKEKLLKKPEKPVEVERDGKNSSDESDSSESGHSSDDDHTWTKEVKTQYRTIEREKRQKDWEERKKKREEEQGEPSMVEVDDDGFIGNGLKRKIDKSSLEQRLKYETATGTDNSRGNKSLTFSTARNKRLKMQQEMNRKHKEERRKIVRKTNTIKLKRPKFKM